MKKSLLFILLSAPLAASATPDNHFQGFYVAASVGAVQGTAASSATLNSSSGLILPSLPSFGSSTFSRSLSLNENSAIGALAVGYGQAWQNFYLGTEAFINVSQYHISNSALSIRSSRPGLLGGLPLPTDTTQSLSTNLSAVQYGIDLRPGFLVDPSTLIYGRIGVVEAKTTLNTSFSSSNASFLSSSNPQKSQYTPGLRLGFGLAHAISEHWNLTLDYIFTSYGSVESSATTTPQPVGLGSIATPYTNTVRTRWYTNAMMTGIAYQFSSGPAMMATHWTASSLFDGIYLNAALGGMRAVSITSQSLTSYLDVAGHLTGPDGVSGSANINKNSWLGSLAAGYGKTWQRFYGGVEAFINVNKVQFRDILSDQTNSISGTSTIFSQHSTIQLHPVQYGFDLRPGFLITPKTLFYGRLGLSEASMTLRSSFKDSANNVSGTIPAKSENLNGLRLGLGLSQAITEHWQVSADYIFTTYGSVATSNTQVITSAQTFEYLTALKARLYTNALMLGATYRF